MINYSSNVSVTLSQHIHNIYLLLIIVENNQRTSLQYLSVD